MKEFFGTIYDTIFGIYNAQFSVIFQHLFDNGGYIKLGLIFILFPLLSWILFYYLWKYPYGKLWHWIVYLLITTVIVFGLTYAIAYTEIFSSNNMELNDALSNQDLGYADYANGLPFKYSIANGILTVLISSIYSLVLKQFSKIQIHLPI